MDLIIVTGMSGAGKSVAINALEDLGYYCVDNVPPRLIGKFTELPGRGTDRQKMALVVDVRSQELFLDYYRCLEELDASRKTFKTLFLDCETGVLINRFKETRRRHPLVSDAQPSIQQAIAREREMLTEARSRADYVLETSRLGPMELKARISELFSAGMGTGMQVSCNSFGFKYGIPVDSDLLFDVRCLPNPFYDPALRELTGLDAPVRDYVLRSEPAQQLVPKLLDLIDFLIPLYIQEGKSQLVVSIGCTGGRHRSVVFSELVARHLEQQGIAATTSHRDIGT